MNKIKIVSLVAVVAVVVATGFLWTSEKKQKRYNPKDFHIQFYDKTFFVSEKVFKQFKVQKKEEEFFQKKVEKKSEQEKLIDKIKKFPSETAPEKVVGAMAKKFLGIKTWNITKYIEDLIPKKHLDEAKRFIAQTIKLLLDIASGKLDPKEVTHSSTLFMIIKIADKLGNYHVMRLCAGPLMRKITGITEFGPSHCFEGHTDYINGFVPLSDGKRALSFSRDRTIRLWDFEKKEQIRVFRGNRESVFRLVVLPGEEQFLSLESEGIIRLRNIATGRQVRSFGEEGRDVNNIILLKDGRRFISLYRNEIRLFSIDQENVIRDFNLEKNARLYGLVLFGDGRFISYGERIRLWSTEREDSVYTFGLEENEHVGAVDSLGDGRFISYGDRMRLRGIDQENVIRTFDENTRGIIPLGDDKFISYLRKIKLWNTKEKDAVHIIDRSAREIACLSECKRILVLPEEQSDIIELVDFETGKVISTFKMRPQDKLNGDRFRKLYVLNGGKQFVSLFYDSPVICLFDIDPFENFTFEQIDFCYDLFEKKVKMSFEVISKNIDTIKSLPKFLRNEIVKIKSFTGDDDDEEEEGEVE